MIHRSDGTAVGSADPDPLLAIVDAGRTGDAAIQQLNEQYQTYVMVEQSLLRRKASLMGKLPDIHKTLDAVNLLQKRQEADESVRPAGLHGRCEQQSNGGWSATLRWGVSTMQRVARLQPPANGATNARVTLLQRISSIRGDASAYTPAGPVRVRAR